MVNGSMRVNPDAESKSTIASTENFESQGSPEAPGSRSRIGILRRYRLCLPSEPGGSARENVALHFELAVLTPPTLEFLALGRGQPVRTPALVPLSLCHPVADRLRSRLELPL